MCFVSNQISNVNTRRNILTDTTTECSVTITFDDNCSQHAVYLHMSRINIESFAMKRQQCVHFELLRFATL